MNFHEFGTDNEKAILLIHPLGVDWHYFDYVHPVLAEKDHVIIPAIPGMDLEDPSLQFTSVEKIAEDIENYIISKNITELECGYGCSMGGATIIRMTANGRINIKNSIVDGGITPYRLPKLACIFIAVGDYLMTSLGKLCSVKMLGYMFDPSKYTKDDLLYVKKILKNMSQKSIWNAFWSTNNYSLPQSIHQPENSLIYWFGEGEKKARKLDIEFVKDTFDKVVFIENKGQDHGEFAFLHPEELCERLEKNITTGVSD